MSLLRVRLDPVPGVELPQHLLVRGMTIGISRFGAGGKRRLEGAATFEFGCAVTDRALKKPGSPTVFATLSGHLRVDGDLARLIDPIVTQVPPLEAEFVVDGHKRPRRELGLDLSPLGGPTTGPSLFLPDDAQIEHGHAEISVALSVDGAAHGDAAINDVLDLPLVPFRQTHAVFRLVDGAGAPLIAQRVKVKSSLDEELEAETDQHGEIYLSAFDGRSYEIIELIQPEEEALALVTQTSTGGLA